MHMKRFFTDHQFLFWLCVIVVVVILSAAITIFKDFSLTSIEEMIGTSHPTSTDSFLLGQYYFNHDEDPAGPYDLEKARHYYKQAIADNPKGNVLLWHQLGRIDFLEGEFEAAIYKFNKQLEYFGEELPNVHYMLGLTYGYQARQEGGDNTWQQAEEHFMTYLTYDPQSPWARVDLAWVYFAQGKYEEMLEPLEVGLTHHPDNAWLLNMYGLALLNNGKKEKAGRYFEWAKEAAAKLTVADWGQSYPGNDPTVWEQGLSEFREVIEKNIALVN